MYTLRELKDDIDHVLKQAEEIGIKPDTLPIDFYDSNSDNIINPIDTLYLDITEDKGHKKIEIRIDIK